MTAPPGSSAAVDGRPWRLSMGLRPLEVAAWLEVDDLRAGELAQKHRLLGDAHDEVVCALAGSEPAGEELLAAVVEHLDHHYPGTLQRRPGGALVDAASGVVTEPSAMHPVDAAGRLVQEDLCVMERRGQAWVLTAASVCFPSRWSLRSKLGSDLTAIHAPVPGYEGSLAGPTEAFFDRLRVDRPVWRRNWTILDRPDLYQPDPATRDASEGIGPDLWLRVERQTLRRLGERAAIVFTIRTHVARLVDVAAAQPELVDRLRRTLPTVPAATVEYKGWRRIFPGLQAWLQDNY